MKRNEDMNILLNYLLTGISAFVNTLPLAFIVFCVFTGVKLLLKTMLIPFRMLCEFIWILIMFMILKITGIIGGDFGITSIIMGNVNFSLDLFEEGLSIAALLNIALFILLVSFPLLFLGIYKANGFMGFYWLNLFWYY